jgi:hypothetical protein
MIRAAKLPLLLGPLAALLAAAALLYAERSFLGPMFDRLTSGESGHFTEAPLPQPALMQLYDLGIVDANGDGHLDIYSSSHNYRQVLWLADGAGGFRDALSPWRLDQNADFPGVEQSMDSPGIDKPGLYVYWRGDVLHLRAHAIEDLGPLKGALRLYNMAVVVAADGFEVSNSVERPAEIGVPMSRVEFSAVRSGSLALYISTRGTPLAFDIDAPWAPASVFVGTQAIVPRSTKFEFSLRDRHGLAWADVNDDGRADIYISRGALGGTLRMFPPSVRDRVLDEFLVSRDGGGFDDRTSAAGFEKKDCSGRHVRWVDFDQDGLLDLFINCQDRGNVAGGYPKQLYRQAQGLRFDDVAAAVGLDLVDSQLVDFVWLDVDDDGRVDLLTHEDTGFFVYRQRDGRFEREFIHRGGFVRADVKGLKGNTDDYWQFDGKLSVVDFNGDGHADVFVASKRGNGMLVNRGGGRFEPVDPVSLGLPKASVAAAWVDFDNDGRPDLHLVPEGLYRQGADGHFSATGYFSLPRIRYQAAFVHWFDRDNDGGLDLVMALQENAALWRWWERPFKARDVKGEDDRFTWALMPYQNIGPRGHWLQVELTGHDGNRPAIGARVTVVTPGGRITRDLGAEDSSYFSQGHYRLYFGLGAHAQADRVEILWPDGYRQVLDKVAADRLLKVARD